jgi:hypothetical protein
MRRTTGLLRHHCKYEGEKMLDLARKTATPMQREAFPAGKAG